MIFLENPMGVRKSVKHGFSWTMFFFGFWVPLIRGDVMWALIAFALDFFTIGFGTCILAFFYNKIYLDKLLSNGYEVM